MPIRITGIVGGPGQVARSLSPAIHNAAFTALGMDWIYATFGITDDVGARIKGLADAGVAGLNVTMPHKIEAMGAMDEVTAEAKRVGAINTVQMHGGRLIGHNTDGPGLVLFLERDLGVTIAGKSAMVIGAGGAARAAIVSLADAGASVVAVAARDPSSVAAFGTRSGIDLVPVKWPPSEAQVRDADIVINATPLGQRGEEVPVSLTPSHVVIDMVYRPPITPLVAAARAAGAMGHSGLGMLLNQAKLSFEIWTGVEPPIGAMSAAAVAEIGNS